MKADDDQRAIPWFVHGTEVVLPVGCGDAEHRVAWRNDGQLHLIDHDDPEADEVFRALGGPDLGCLQIQDLWRAAIKDGGFLGEWAFAERRDQRRTHWLGTAWRRLVNEGVQDFLRGIDQKRAIQMGSVLLRFSDDLLDRAATTALADQGSAIAGDPWLMGHVIEATHVRARSAFVRSLDGWRAHARPAALVPLHAMVLPGVVPDATGRLQGKHSHVELILNSDWLARVWARGASDIDGHLVIDIDDRAIDGVFNARLLAWHAGPGHLVGRVETALITHDAETTAWRLHGWADTVENSAARDGSVPLSAESRQFSGSQRSPDSATSPPDEMGNDDQSI